MLLIVVCAVTATAFVVSGASGQSDATAAKQGAGAKYTVVETDGELLIVTDNSRNTLYFYTTDEGSQAGTPMKLRGAIDLNEVGTATITPRIAKKDE
jgi:hypothetical protein